mgnify:CR=1 FL=1
MTRTALSLAVLAALASPLAPAQEQALWEAVIDAGEVPLASPTGAAQLAAEAWSLAHQWQIADRLRHYALTEDTRVFAKWAAEYFFIPHRGVHRGVGGIFYDHLECPDDAAWERNFTFTQDVGKAFLDVYPKLVRRRMGMEYTPEDKRTQLEWRGRYAEFNLVYDRGTLFGLKTGGNIEAILMSLPPEAVWT